MSEEIKRLCILVGLGKKPEVEAALADNPSLVMPYKKGRREKSAFLEAKILLEGTQKHNPTEEGIRNAREMLAIVRSASIVYAIDNYDGEGYKLALHMQEQGETFTQRLLSGKTPSQYAGRDSRFSSNVEVINRSSQTEIQAELGLLYSKLSIEGDSFVEEMHQVVSSNSK